MKKECLYLLTFNLLAKTFEVVLHIRLSRFLLCFSLFFLALGSKSKMIVTKYVLLGLGGLNAVDTVYWIICITIKQEKLPFC